MIPWKSISLFIIIHYRDFENKTQKINYRSTLVGETPQLLKKISNNSAPCQCNIVVCATYDFLHLVFSGLCNIVICTTYDFLQNRQLLKNSKWLIWIVFIVLNGIIFCTVWVKVYTQKVNNFYEIEDEKCRMYTLDFPVSAI